MKERAFMEVLRSRAIHRLNISREDGSELGLEQLLEEARIYEIELEIQNEELQLINGRLDHTSSELRELFESAPVAYLELDRDGVIRRMNVLARELFDGRGLNQPLDRFILNKSHAQLRAQLTGAGAGVLEPLLCHFDTVGRRWWGELRMRLVRPGQSEEGVLCAVSDVTRQHLTQQALSRAESDQRRLLETLPDAIFAIQQRHISYANATAHRLLGATPGALMSRHIQTLLAPEDRSRVMSWLSQPHKLSDEPLDEELSFVHSSGEQVRVEVRAMPSHIDGLQVLIWSCRDLTERRLMEAQMAQVDRLASLGVLVAGIAHEVNNPLSVISNSIALLQDALLESDASDDLQMLAEHAIGGVDRVSRIVTDLRYLSQERPLERVSIQVNEITIQTLKLIEPKLLGKVTLAHDLGAIPPILGDEARLGQVLINLLLNAQGAMPAERPSEQNRIRIRTWLAGSDICIEVKDNGKGIPEENLSRLFNPFFTTRREDGGTGLGLAVSNSIIQQMGGRLEVSSSLGEGSSFTIYLPTTTAKPAPARAAAKTTLQLERILLVEDEPVLRDTMRRLLSRFGTVDVASSGNEAISTLSSGTDYSLILSDVIMADGDGPALLQWIQRQRPALLPVLVFTSGMVNDDYFSEIRRAGCAILDKPIRPRDLEELLSCSLDPSAREALPDTSK